MWYADCLAKGLSGWCAWCEGANPAKMRLLPKPGRLNFLEWGARLFSRTTVSLGTGHSRLLKKVSKVSNFEALGHLAGGIAHDFNNLMTAVNGNIEIALMTLSGGHEVVETLNNALEASKRTKDLTGQILTFSKGGAPMREVTPLAPVIEEVCLDLFVCCTSEHETSDGHHSSRLPYSLAIADDLWSPFIDRHQIKKALSHILRNAKEVIASSGEIVVCAQNVSLSPEKHPTLAAGTYVLLTIQDTGAGIDRNILPMIFNPYFSTKKHHLYAVMAQDL